MALVALATVGTAAGQQIRASGGLRVTLDSVTMEASVERPSLDLLGVRWGPTASLRASATLAGAGGASAHLVAGVSGTIVIPDQPWGVQVQLLTRAILQTGTPARVGPELVIAWTGAFGP